MQSLLQLRKKLGLKQEEMAALLGTTRSRLSHAEAGRRLLEAHAMEQLAVLLQAAGESPGPSGYPDETDAMAESVAFYLSDIRYQLTGLIKRQKEQTAKHQQHQLLGHCIRRLSHSSHQARHTKRQTRWIEELQYSTAKKQQQSAGETGFFLELEIKTLQYQIRLCKDFLETGELPEEE